MSGIKGGEIAEKYVVHISGSGYLHNYTQRKKSVNPNVREVLTLFSQCIIL